MAGAGRRTRSFAAAVGLLAAAALAWPTAATPAAAAPAPTPSQQPADLCTTEEWQIDFRSCVDRLDDVTTDEMQCLEPPIPTAPDSGLAGWFASRPESSDGVGPQGLYSRYGYAGYSFTTYDIEGGCASTVLHPDYRVTTTIANLELMAATAIIGASNALREKAWAPDSMWTWADSLVEQATTAVYEKVFGVFGLVTLCVIGLYLLWRSRQADMNNATTTVGWALLIMLVVTAIAAWPVRSANLADSALVGTLGVVHEAVGPRPENRPESQCRLGDPEACQDRRPPATRASDKATESLLYRNWLRGVLGSSDSETAKKYGQALYDARSLSWTDAEKLTENPSTRTAAIEAKQQQWIKVARQIKTEDPEAYEHLTGVRDTDRIGASFIALLASAMFAMFDLTASILVLLGFMIFRWAVIAAPILGTIGLMRPASAGIRRLGNAVVAAVFNIAIFGTGAAIYLLALDIIMSTSTLPGWLQVVLMWLCGIVGWLLLRPYRRITKLGGGRSSDGVDRDESWGRRFFRDMREAARLEPAEVSVAPDSTRRLPLSAQRASRPESRGEDSVAHRNKSERSAQPESAVPGTTPQTQQADSTSPQTTPRRRAAEWTEADVPMEPANYAIYRPGGASPAPSRVDKPAKVRSEVS